MCAVFPIIFITWKLVKRSKWLKPHEVVLRTSEVDDIEEYTRTYVARKPPTIFHAFADKLFS